MMPALLGGMMSKAATPQGAGDLFKMVQGLNIDTGSLGNIAGMLAGAAGGGGGASALQSMGTSLLTGLLGGDKTNNLASALSSVAGIKPSSASSLLSLGAPLVMGVVKKMVGDGGLDASGLASALLGQKSALQGVNLDPRITGALGFNSMSSMLGALPNAAAATGAAAAAGASGLRRWLPWIIGALALLLLWNWFSGRKTETAPVPAPAAVEAPVAAPVAPAVAVTLPASVYFETGSAAIGDEGKATISGAAAILAAEGGNVAVTGHTDKTGDAAANEELAKQRALAVRDALMAAGVAESSIVMQPPMFVTGAINDREARRVDITRP
jgi:outer membrane protein OmpA-like peptidoglycan-associated protein